MLVLGHGMAAADLEERPVLQGLLASPVGAEAEVHDLAGGLAAPLAEAHARACSAHERLAEHVHSPQAAHEAARRGQRPQPRRGVGLGGVTTCS